jgi:Ni,Fe-hydrogenase III component G
MFKKNANENPAEDLDEMDDSTETVTVSTNVVLKNLKNVYTFLLQQENANECMIQLKNLLERNKHKLLYTSTLVNS